MSIKIMSAVWDGDFDESGNELNVLLYLANKSNDDGNDCFPGIDLIADCCRLSTRTVKRIIKKLRLRGRIWVGKRQGRRSHQYKILFSGTPETNFAKGDTRVTHEVTPVSPVPVTPVSHYSSGTRQRAVRPDSFSHGEKVNEEKADWIGGPKAGVSLTHPRDPNEIINLFRSFKDGDGDKLSFFEAKKRAERFVRINNESGWELRNWRASARGLNKAMNQTG